MIESSETINASTRSRTNDQTSRSTHFRYELVEIAPAATRIARLFNPDNPVDTRAPMRADDTARNLGREIVHLPVPVAKLSADITAVVRSPQVQQQLASLTVETVTSTPEKFDIFIREELARWADVVKRAGIKLE